MRKPLVAGNWKMHGSESQAKWLMNGIKNGALELTSCIDILVLPSFVYLSEARNLFKDTAFMWGAQNLYPGKEGAFTGEVSGSMLSDLGCQYVLVGHSERRTIFHEDLNLIALKFKSAIDANLKPILCIGETQAEREVGQTENVIAKQIQSVIDVVGMNAFAHAVIAYEPVWAIGTGLTATSEMAQETHAFIRNYLAKNNVDIAKTIRILYGGSMKADNAESLLLMPDIDGGLVGGASLDANSFLAICRAAKDTMNLSLRRNGQTN